jgi:hypothetical protein
MKLTGAAILVSRGMKVLKAAPAAYPYRSAVPRFPMNEKYHRTQYLIGVTAGAACLALWMIVYQMEGAFIKASWIHERTTGWFVLLFMAVLSLFLASIHHAKMLFAGQSPEAPRQPTAPAARTKFVVTWTLIVTGVVASVVEFQCLSMEGNWDLPDIMESTTGQATLFGLPIEVGVGAVGFVSVGPLGVGVISVGGFGVLAFQGIGIVSVGGVGLGVIGLGGAASGGIAIGGAALGFVAIGGGAMGVYVLGASGKGRYVLSKQRHDPEAVALFGKWVPGVRRVLKAEQGAAADRPRD